jgi:hypothetical protein
MILFINILLGKYAAINPQQNKIPNSIKISVVLTTTGQ